MSIHYSACLYGALLVLMLPLDWILSALAAALFHELCHMIPVLVSRGSIHRIHIHMRGCMIETSPIGERLQLISILAGPIGSLSLLLFSRKASQIAICGFFQGAYNLLPVMPLDGGRILRLIRCRYAPNRAEYFMELVEIGSCILLDVLAVWVYLTIGKHPLPILMALFWNIRLLTRKIPCKPSEIGVQ